MNEIFAEHTSSNTRLISHQKGSKTGLVELSNSEWGIGIDLKTIDFADVTDFFAHSSVTVQENSALHHKAFKSGDFNKVSKASQSGNDSCNSWACFFWPRIARISRISKD